MTALEDEGRRKAYDDAKVLPELLDRLPIYAVRIGYRDDSTPAEQRLGEALLAVGRKWQEVKP